MERQARKALVERVEAGAVGGIDFLVMLVMSAGLALTLAFLVVAFLGATGASAQQEHDDWLTRVHYVHVWPGSDTLRVENPVGERPAIFTEFFTDGGNGFGAECKSSEYSGQSESNSKGRFMDSI